MARSKGRFGWRCRFRRLKRSTRAHRNGSGALNFFRRAENRNGTILRFAWRQVPLLWMDSAYLIRVLRIEANRAFRRREILRRGRQWGAVHRLISGIPAEPGQAGHPRNSTHLQPRGLRCDEVRGGMAEAVVETMAKFIEATKTCDEARRKELMDEILTYS